MPHAYTEDQIVEQPAIGLFAEMGWQVVSASEETFGAAGTLQRETKGEVVLVARLRAALERLNPTLPPEAIATALDELTRDRSAMVLEQANREGYRLLKEGIRVSVPDLERGGQKTERVRVVDWSRDGGRRTTSSCSSASSASPARSTPAGRIWWASSMACPWWSSS